MTQRIVMKLNSSSYSHLNSRKASFAPLILSARGEIEAYEDYFIVRPGQKLFVSDGQHRTLALLSAIIELTVRAERAESEKRIIEAENYRQYIEQLKNMPMALQIYLNLTRQQEKQLFADLNTKRKAANPNIRLQHDQRSEYNILTRTVADQLKYKMEIDTSTARLSPASSAITSLSAMKKCLIALFEGIIGRKAGESNLPTINSKLFKLPSCFSFNGTNYSLKSDESRHLCSRFFRHTDCLSFYRL